MEETLKQETAFPTTLAYGTVIRSMELDHIWLFQMVNHHSLVIIETINSMEKVL